MCGICGFVSKKNISLETLNRMNDTMYHRGPDDSGAELYDAKDSYNIGLAHRRLSILDLSPNGHQPMHSNNKRLTVVFNGEIYNHLSLRKELSDYPYSSSCDTEVILAAYIKWGRNFVEHIHGMFAIAIYDREDSSLCLYRDRIGKKPLYYMTDTDGIIFASELKPIMKCPEVALNINTDVIPRYIFQQYIHGPETIYRNVFKLEPGGALCFQSGTITKWKYWDINDVYRKMSLNPVKDYDEAKTTLKNLLNDAVASRMIADVPIGTFLSGGYDSSLVTAIAQAQSSTPIKTFCIGFNIKEFNEAVYAKEIARYLGTDHTELYIDELQMRDMLDSIATYYDEPFADSSQIPSMLVSKLAKESVTVALSGDGGDEFFCGYNIYKNVADAQILDPLGAVANFLGEFPIPKGKLKDRYPFRVKLIANNRDLQSKTQIASDSYIYTANQFLSKSNKDSGSILPVKYPIEGILPSKKWQIKRMLLDMQTYLPDDILVKMDRASMKYSLENRAPLMDTSIMEYSFRIPHKYKYYKGDKKHILKDLAYDYIPRQMLDRPKQGFGVPMDSWLRGPLKDALTEYCNRDYLVKQNIFDPDFVSSFVHNYIRTGDAGPATGGNYSKLVWSFFIFQQWYDFQSCHSRPYK